MMQLKDKSPIILFVVGMLLCISGAVFAADPPSVATESPADRQLRINKNALLQGPTQENHYDAAMALLSSPDVNARKVLTETLAVTDNPAGRGAICSALVSSRISNQTISNKGDFLVPLLSMLSTEQGHDAQLAAEAMLIFDFTELAPQLKEIRLSANTAKHTRLNIIYALELRHSDKNAIAELVGFLGDPDKDVASAAGAALPYWTQGMQPKKILSDLKRKSQQDIIMHRMDFLEKEFVKIKAERNSWLTMYVQLLDKTYESSDDIAKAKLLFEKLDQNSPAVIKLWALEKVSIQSGSVNMPEGFAERLFILVSDPDKKVRLAAANLLSKKSDLNSAEKLLAQLKIEEYADVKLAVLDALGETCYFALISTEITLPEQVRKDALAAALSFFKSDDPANVRTGAVVLRKLIEPNGMKKEVINAYLQDVLIRYNRITESELSLKPDLLDVMAQFAGLPTTREDSAKLFEKSFVAALSSGENKPLREAAVLGLTNIDKAAALDKFTERAMYNDESSIITESVIKLAGQIGTASDIDWLAGKLEANGTGKLAWQSMREILRREKSLLVTEWAGKLLLSNANPGYINELINIAEKKVATEDNADGVSVRINEELIPALLDVYLKAGETSRISQIVSKRLAGRGDIGPDDKAVLKIEAFFVSQQVDIKEKTKLLTVLKNIKIPANAGIKWTQQLSDWQKKLTPEPKPVPAAATPVQ
jgi:HEAT repeat protein